MDFLNRLARGLSLLSGAIAGLLLAAAVIVVCQMVYLRFWLNENTIWQTDFVIYTLVAATFMGLPYVLVTGGHVNVDIVPLFAGKRLRFGLAIFATLLSLTLAALMTALTYKFWHEAYLSNEVSNSMWRARLWFHYAAMPIGLGILTLQYVVDFLNLITGRVPPFGITPDKELS